MTVNSTLLGAPTRHTASTWPLDRRFAYCQLCPSGGSGCLALRLIGFPRRRKASGLEVIGVGG